jgi:hypothetical protein
VGLGHITWFSYGSNTRDAVGRVSRSRVAFDVVATVACSWILAATASRWILTATAFNMPSRPEFQHSSPTFGPGILATAVGTSSWRTSPAMGIASINDTDVAAASTFFFATDGKTSVPPFNCYIRNMSKCRTTCLLVHLCLQATFFVGWTRLHRCGSEHGRIRRRQRRWHRQRRGTVIELCYM